MDKLLVLTVIPSAWLADGFETLHLLLTCPGLCEQATSFDCSAFSWHAVDYRPFNDISRSVWQATSRPFFFFHFFNDLVKNWKQRKPKSQSSLKYFFKSYLYNFWYIPLKFCLSVMLLLLNWTQKYHLINISCFTYSPMPFI